MKGLMSWGILEWGGLVLIGLCALQTYRLQSEKLEHEKTQGAMSRAAAAAERAARTASDQYRQQEQTWTTRLNGVRADAQKEIGAARDAAKSADLAAGRLQLDYSRALTAYRGLAAAATCDANGSEAADKAGDLLADVQRRLDEAAGGIALFADLSYAAAEAGWASGEALKD